MRKGIAITALTLGLCIPAFAQTGQTQSQSPMRPAAPPNRATQQRDAKRASIVDHYVQAISDPDSEQW